MNVSRRVDIRSIQVKNTPLYKNTPLVCPGSVTRGGILKKVSLFFLISLFFPLKTSPKTLFLQGKSRFGNSKSSKFSPAAGCQHIAYCHRLSTIQLSTETWDWYGTDGRHWQKSNHFENNYNDRKHSETFKNRVFGPPQAKILGVILRLFKNTPLYKNTPLVCPGFVTRGVFLTAIPLMAHSRSNGLQPVTHC